MADYFFEVTYEGIVYQKEEVNFKEFEQCTFTNCDFRNCLFVAVTFIDCTFHNCNFDTTKVNYVAFRTVTFNHCSFREVNFAMSDKLIFEMHFNNCILDFTKFYTLKIRTNSFTNCSMIAIDFMATDLTGVIFDNCDLYRSEFEKAIANKANFKTSYNYTIDPTKTKLKKAIFSLEGAKGLLFKHELVIKE